MTSATLRSTVKIILSAGPDSPADRPARVTAPSALATMFARRRPRPGWRTEVAAAPLPYKDASRLTASGSGPADARGMAWRTGAAARLNWGKGRKSPGPRELRPWPAGPGVTRLQDNGRPP